MDLVSIDMRMMTGEPPLKQTSLRLDWTDHLPLSMSKNMIIVLIHSHNIILYKYLHYTIQSKKE